MEDVAARCETFARSAGNGQVSAEAPSRVGPARPPIIAAMVGVTPAPRVSGISVETAPEGRRVAPGSVGLPSAQATPDAGRSARHRRVRASMIGTAVKGSASGSGPSAGMSHNGRLADTFPSPPRLRMRAVLEGRPLTSTALAEIDRVCAITETTVLGTRHVVIFRCCPHGSRPLDCRVAPGTRRFAS
jgi:hypothetical protein